MRAAEPKTFHSKLSVKNRTALPREVRERLKISPGDRLRYVVDDKGVRIEKVEPARGDEPFTVFFEWSSEADEEAFVDL